MPELSYYGDDFTGSTDVMEALTGNGVPTVLFTRLPSTAQRARFPEARAIGLAGESRSRSPDWMDRHLPQVFDWLQSLGARHCHYKTCSTFDSGPGIGSIGRAAEIGLRAFGQRHAHVVVGAPQLRRYTMFGTLFASFQEEIHRIDRHPVMARHPATPMAEADLRRHLAGQTDLPMGVLGPEIERQPSGIAALRRSRAAGDRLTLLDVYDAASQARVGALIEEALAETGPFIIGSSGVEYALIRAWQAAGQIPEPEGTRPLERQEVIAVVSGSCSPTTERQIRHACLAGFRGIAVDYAALAYGQGAEAALDAAFDSAAQALRNGQSPIMYTALGAPDTNAPEAANDRVGQGLGRLLDRVMTDFELPRVGVAGGDTSSHALSILDTYALTLRRPLPDTPGSPVCLAHREGKPGFEIALKGGQVGADAYFVTLRDGL